MSRGHSAVPHLGPSAAIVTSIVVLLAFLLLSIRQLRRMDVP